MDIKLGIMPARIVLFLAVLTVSDAQWPARNNYPARPSPTPNAYPQNPPVNYPNNNNNNYQGGFGQYATNPPMNFGNYQPPSQNYNPPPSPAAPSPANNYGNNSPPSPPPIRHPPPLSNGPPAVNYNPPPPRAQRPRPHPRPGATYPGAGTQPDCKFMCQMTGNMEVNPRCGYDGKTHRNECYLRCALTYEACDGTCPCYTMISNHGFLQPAPGVFPSPNAGKRKRRRKQGRRPDCKTPCPFTNELICTETNQMMSECEAYCTYNRIKCDGPCHTCFIGAVRPPAAG